MLHRAAALSLRAIARRPLLETASSCFRIVVRSQFRCSFKSQQDDTSKKKKPQFVLPYSHLSIRTVPPATPISLDFQSPLRSQSCSGDQLRMFHDMRSPTDTAPSATTGAAATLDKAAQHVRCPLGIIRQKNWFAMDSETRLHWKTLGWESDSWSTGPNPASDSKNWSQLSEAERSAAQWLGYDEFRWKDDNFNPFSNFHDEDDDFIPLWFKDENKFLEKEIPMTSSQRQALKTFILAKEAQALSPTDAANRDVANEVLETGAVDCLYGLYTLFQKILFHQTKLNDAREEHLGDTLDTVSNAGWLQAIKQSQSLSDEAKMQFANLNEEEARIAQLLFDAADLDDKHSISFTEFAMLAVLLSATDARDADAQVELLVNMIITPGGDPPNFFPPPSSEHVEKDAARSFVLTCLRSGVRIDLKPQKSATGLVAHGMLDGLPVDLKEVGLAEEAGMIVLRERHRHLGNAWKAADAIVEKLFKLMDPDGNGYIPKQQFKDFFVRRLHPELERHSQSHFLTSHSPHATLTHGQTWDFNRVVQGARAHYQERQASRRSGGRGSGCFVSGSEVLTAGGVQVSIDKLQLGDSVMAFDSDGTLRPATVRGCMTFLSDNHYVITLNNGNVMRVTGQHPICTGLDAFCRADVLCVGHRVMIRAFNETSLQSAIVTSIKAVDESTVVYNLSTTPYHTFFAADVAVHNKGGGGGGGGGGGCFSGDVLLTVIEKNATRRHVCMRHVKPGDVIEGGGRVLAIMSFLRSSAAPLHRYRGSVVTADHAVKTPSGWKRIRDTEAHPLSEAEAAAQGDVLFDIITENHQFSSADGVVYADYEEVDDVTPENYRRLIRELNLRDFGRADR